jgi:hypothetical protein
MVPIPREAIVMSPCSVCGQRVVGNAGLCAHHDAVSTDSWALGNRILCDFLHRGIAPARLPASERIDEATQRLAETA